MVTRRGSAGRAVFWVIALVAIGGLAFYIYNTKKNSGTLVPGAPTADAMATYFAAAHEEGFSEAGGARLSAKTREAAAFEGKQWLGKDVTLQETVDKGLEFRGAGEAFVPDPSSEVGARSAQYIFVTDGSAGEAGQRVSMFLQVDRRAQAGLPLLERDTKSYKIKAPASLGAGAPDIVVAQKGGVIYYLVANTAAGLAPLKAAYGIPDPSEDMP